MQRWIDFFECGPGNDCWFSTRSHWKCGWPWQRIKPAVSSLHMVNNTPPYAIIIWRVAVTSVPSLQGCTYIQWAARALIKTVTINNWPRGDESRPVLASLWLRRTEWKQFFVLMPSTTFINWFCQIYTLLELHSIEWLNYTYRLIEPHSPTVWTTLLQTYVAHLTKK